jgi:hypothetical protein
LLRYLQQARCKISACRREFNPISSVPRALTLEGLIVKRIPAGP